MFTYLLTEGKRGKGGGGCGGGWGGGGHLRRGEARQIRSSSVADRNSVFVCETA